MFSPLSRTGQHLPLHGGIMGKTQRVPLIALRPPLISSSTSIFLSFCLYVKSPHGNITRRYDLAPLLLCCWKGEILQCNTVSLLFNMLRLVENKDLTSDSTISAGDAAVRAGIWKVVFHHQWRGPSN
jgi:hypothetical protein